VVKADESERQRLENLKAGSDVRQSTSNFIFMPLVHLKKALKKSRNPKNPKKYAYKI
jgi:hypothetical protein